MPEKRRGRGARSSRHRRRSLSASQPDEGLVTSLEAVIRDKRKVIIRAGESGKLLCSEDEKYSAGVPLLSITAAN
jgi:hypothetical protein